jgi:hypothetical protein
MEDEFSRMDKSVAYSDQGPTVFDRGRWAMITWYTNTQAYVESTSYDSTRAMSVTRDLMEIARSGFGQPDSISRVPVGLMVMRLVKTLVLMLEGLVGD